MHIVYFFRRGRRRRRGGIVDFALASSHFFLGQGAPDGQGALPLHNSRYDFNDDVIPIGASYWVRLVEQLLRPSPSS